MLEAMNFRSREDTSRTLSLSVIVDLVEIELKGRWGGHREARSKCVVFLFIAVTSLVSVLSLGFMLLLLRSFSG